MSSTWKYTYPRASEMLFVLFFVFVFCFFNISLLIYFLVISPKPVNIERKCCCFSPASTRKFARVKLNENLRLHVWVLFN